MGDVEEILVLDIGFHLVTSKILSVILRSYGKWLGVVWWVILAQFLPLGVSQHLTRRKLLKLGETAPHSVIHQGAWENACFAYYFRMFFECLTHLCLHPCRYSGGLLFK